MLNLKKKPLRKSCLLIYYKRSCKEGHKFSEMEYEGTKKCQGQCKSEKECSFLKQCDRCGELRCNVCIREGGSGHQD